MNITIKFETEKTGEGSFLHLLVETSEIGQHVNYIHSIEEEEAIDDDKIDILSDFLNERIVDIEEVNKIAREMLYELEEKQADEALSRFEDENGGFLY